MRAVAKAVKMIRSSILFDADYYRRSASVQIANKKRLILHFLETGGQTRANPHPLFDMGFYLEGNPDVAAEAMNPLLHFLFSGGKEVRSPHPLFDTSYYIDQVPGLESSEDNPLVHFLTRGAKAGRNPNPLFDIPYYISHNPGVDQLNVNPLVHYLLCGAADGLDPHRLFDTSFYEDNRTRIGSGFDNPLVHFLTATPQPGLDPHPLFDVEHYLRLYADVADSGINPLLHYVMVGGSEGRVPHPLFDVEYYLRQAPDLQSSGESSLVHYLRRGAREGKDPHPLFNTRYYVDNASDIDPEFCSPLVHFLRRGAREGRNPHPLFDTHFYLAGDPGAGRSDMNPLVRFLRSKGQKVDPHPLFDVGHYLGYNPDVTAAKTNPLLHFVTTGASENRSPHPLIDLSHLGSTNGSAALDGLERFIRYVSSPPSPGLDPHPLFDTARLMAEHPTVVDCGGNALAGFLDAAMKDEFGPRQQMDLFHCLACFVGIKKGRYDPEKLFRALTEECDESETIGPVLRTIEQSFEGLLFRPPVASERAYHLAHFFHRCPTRADRRTAVSDDSIVRHLGIRPLRTNLDTVNQCNLRCKMCYFNHFGYSRKTHREMSVAEFRRLAEALFPFSSQVFLSFGYEPLCHSQLETILEITAEYDVPFLTMTTNALLFSRRTIDAMIGSGMHRLYISTDAGTEETYRMIRKGGSLTRVIDNVRLINDAKFAAGSDHPRLSFNYVMMHSNIHELPDLIRLAKSLDVSSVEAIHAVLYSFADIDMQQESLWYHKDLSNRVLDEARETAARCGVEFICPEPFTETAVDSPPSGCGTAKQSVEDLKGEMHGSLATLPFRQIDSIDSMCYWPWHFVGIDPYGNVNPCGWWHQAEPMGNVLEDSFDSIWLGAGYSALRNDLVDGRMRPVCEMCPSNGSGDTNSARAFRLR